MKTAGEALGWGLGVAGALAGFSAQEPASTVKSERSGASAWVEKLASPVYAERVEATRKLCGLGAEAREALEEARRHDSFEVSTRAAQILTVLEHQFFAGVRVKLSASKASMAWDEPFDVRIEFENTSKYETLVPFAESAGGDAGGIEPSELEQATAMIDAGDLLEVKDGAGQAVPLRLDDINEEPSIFAMISARASSGPVRVLKPGERFTLVLPRFNRGWARFPLTAAGEATIRFSYVPEWPDDETFGEFNRQRVGEVTCEEIRVRVTRGAPELLARSSRQADLRVERAGDEYVASVVCVYDKPIQLNMQYGATAPFAQFQWVLRDGDEDRLIAGAEHTRWRLKDFTASGFVSLKPGESLELGRLKLDQVRQACGAHARPSLQPCPLSASYINLCSRAWQMEQERRNAEEWSSMPEDLRRPLPLRIFAGQLRSEPVSIHGE